MSKGSQGREFLAAGWSLNQLIRIGCVRMYTVSPFTGSLIRIGCVISAERIQFFARLRVFTREGAGLALDNNLSLNSTNHSSSDSEHGCRSAMSPRLSFKAMQRLMSADKCKGTNLLGWVRGDEQAGCTRVDVRSERAVMECGGPMGTNEQG